MKAHPQAIPQLSEQQEQSSLEIAIERADFVSSQRKRERDSLLGAAALRSSNRDEESSHAGKLLEMKSSS